MNSLRAMFPPTAKPEILGYLTDVNQIGYSRDIGRSFTLGGNIYHLFGDTFCKNAQGEYVGLTNNTVSMVLDKNKPLESSYLCVEDNGMIPPLIPLNAEEKKLEQDHPEQRVLLWGFGGVVEFYPGGGLMWYQKWIQHKDPGNDHHVYHGIGLARLSVDEETNTLQTDREPGLLFHADEPKFGSFSALSHGPYIYLYGERGNDMLIARVWPHFASVREDYEHWDGKGWVEGDFSRSASLFSELPQGAVFRSPSLFGAPHGSFILVGVNKWADSMIRVGVAQSPEGPWNVHEAALAKGIDYPDKYMYCIYPHPWYPENDPTSLMVTWSEHWPGGVVAAKLKFEVTMQDSSRAREEL